MKEDKLKKMRERFNHALEKEREFRKNALSDQRFYFADPDNGYQWEDRIRKSRDLNQRPSLTINKVRQNCLNVMNENKMNMPGVKITPVGDKASFKSAQTYQSLVYHIMRRGSSETALEKLVDNLVQVGVGYVRLLSDYVDEESFDQDIYLRALPDVFNVLMDPDAIEPDGRDARYCFIFQDIPEDQFKELYPKYASEDYALKSLENLQLAAESWRGNDYTRIAEYYEKREKKVTIFKLPNGQIVSEENLAQITIDELKADKEIVKRVVKKYEIWWMKIIGDRVESEQKIIGSFIPVIKACAEEAWVSGKLDRKGHVRNMKDSQRMYNYNASAQVEFVALQSKVPWIVGKTALNGFEAYWNSANVENFAYLPYNDRDEDDKEVTPPQKPSPPMISPGYQQGMDNALRDIELVSGQTPTSLGQAAGERSGYEIVKRERRSELATYHYTLALKRAVQYIGDILLEWIPLVYSEERILKIVTDIGDEKTIRIDPNAQDAQSENDIGEIIFNPDVGKYQIAATVGPSFTSRREEAVSAYMTLIAQAPQLSNVIGDLLLRATDFPFADEAAERLKRLLPPQASGIGPTPREQELMQKLQELSSQLQIAQGALLKANIDHQLDQMEIKSKDQLRDTKVYEAETKRMGVIKDIIAPEVLRPIVLQLVRDALQTDLISSVVKPQASEGTMLDKDVDTDVRDILAHQRNAPMDADEMVRMGMRDNPLVGKRGPQIIPGEGPSSNAPDQAPIGVSPAE